jgi:hypothetical protein
MSHRRLRVPRGLTLVELMISAGLMTMAVAAATTLMTAGSRMATNNELRGAAEDSARLAMNAIVQALQTAGMGTPGGLWVNQGGPRLVNSIFGLDGTTGAGGTPTEPTATGTDDLWLVVPDRNALRETCVEAGAAAVNFTTGTGALDVNCVASFSETDTLMATNMTSGALLTPPLTLSAPSGTPGTLGYTPGILDYQESTVAGFSDSPASGGFSPGDLIMRVRLQRFFVAPNPANHGRPALWLATGRLGTDALGRPFTDTGTGTSSRLIQDDIEELQIAFGYDVSGQGDPASYSFQHGRAAAYSAGLRTLQVSVVATSAKPQRDSQGALRPFRRMAAGNHDLPTPLPEPDGYYRVLLTRRIELPNMAASAL